MSPLIRSDFKLSLYVVTYVKLHHFTTYLSFRVQWYRRKLEKKTCPIWYKRAIVKFYCHSRQDICSLNTLVDSKHLYNDLPWNSTLRDIGWQFHGKQSFDHELSLFCLDKTLFIVLQWNFPYIGICWCFRFLFTCILIFCLLFKFSWFCNV